MIPQSTINACVKAWYAASMSGEDTDYGKIQAVLMAYESIRPPAPPTAIPDGMEDGNGR